MKWTQLGGFEVIANDDGKIIAHIQCGLPQSPLQPVDAVLRGKSLGKYISIKTAKQAIEDALGVDSEERREGALNQMLGHFRRMRQE